MMLQGQQLPLEAEPISLLVEAFVRVVWLLSLCCRMTLLVLRPCRWSWTQAVHLCAWSSP